jgi:hypothetical protein
MSFKLNRFPADKQDQIEQLIAYAQLMGLTGRDLVSIGGKMDREQAKERKIANMAIVNGFECFSIGQHDLDFRFKLKTVNGTYNFEFNGYDGWKITSLKTQQRRTHRVDDYMYDLPKTQWRRRRRYIMLLDISAGHFNLDF